MDFVKEFENTLENTIQQGLYKQAHQLISTFSTTKLPYTMKLFSLINRLRRCEQPFHFPLSAHTFRIVLFQTGNYILDYISTQFATFLACKGCDILFFDPSDFDHSSETLFTFASHGIDAAFFFNNVGLLQHLRDQSNLWEALGVPCFDFLVDHPMYYADSLDCAPASTTVLCADKAHCSYVKRFYPQVAKTLFLPTGGASPSAFPTPSWEARPIDILFIGSYKCNTDYPYDELDSFVMTYLPNHTDCPFESAVELYVKTQMGLSDIPDDSLKEIIESHRFTETNLTALYRKTIIEDIVTSGISIHVYGQGWEQSGLTQYPNFLLHEPVSFAEGIRLMSQAKILLNHMAWFKYGSSERIFNAMSQGALCVTDSSFYLENDAMLHNGKNCFLYPLSQVSDHYVSKLLSRLLSSPETSASIASKGLEKAREHTWIKHLEALTSHTESDFSA